MKEIYREIDTLEKTEFNVLKYQRKSEASAGWILMAFVSLMLEFLTRTTLFKSVAE